MKVYLVVFIRPFVNSEYGTYIWYVYCVPNGKMVSFTFRLCDTGVAACRVTDLSSQLSCVRRRGSKDAKTGKRLAGAW